MTGTDREAMTPHQAIADALRGWADPDHTDPDPKIEAALAAACAADVEVALAAAGFEVVSSDLVSAAELVVDVGEPEGPITRRLFIERLDRLAACLARHRGDSPLNVFTEGGA